MSSRISFNTMQELSSATNPKRLLSLDTLRGMDMLMISGAGSFIFLLHGKTRFSWVNTLAMQFEHPAWNGFTFYDFIFPLFLFIAGTSIPLSIHHSLANGMTRGQIYRKALVRMTVLIVLGIFDKNTPITFFDWSEIRFAGVLQRIGIAGFASTWIYLNFSFRARIIVIACILVMYYALLFLVPVPSFGAGDLSIEGNLVGWIDRHFLPGRLLQKTYDENGILTQFPALCLTVMGTLAADILRRSTDTEGKILRQLLISGGCCVAVGLLWSMHFPINKHLWTSSFVLLTGGIAFLALSILYWVVDVLQFDRWTFFFRVIGMNSLVIYLTYRFIDFGYTSRMLFGGLYAPLAQTWHPVLESMGALVIVWLFLYWLYQRRIFIKV
jgi:predicted acyltransferase